MVVGVRDHINTHTMANLELWLSPASKQASYSTLVFAISTAQHVHNKFNIAATRSGMLLLLRWRQTSSWSASCRQSKCMVSEFIGDGNSSMYPTLLANVPDWGSHQMSQHSPYRRALHCLLQWLLQMLRHQYPSLTPRV